MHTQSIRFQRLTGITMAALLVTAGFLSIEDTNDQTKVEAAVEQLKVDANTSGDTATDMAVKTAAINALHNGIAVVAGMNMGENFGFKDIERYARSIAGTKFDFDALNKYGYKFNEDLVQALQDGQTDGNIKGEISALDVQEIGTVVANLDSAFNALQIAGVPTELLKRNFAAVGLNATLDVIGQIALNWPGEVVEA